MFMEVTPSEVRTVMVSRTGRRMEGEEVTGIDVITDSSQRRPDNTPSETKREKKLISILSILIRYLQVRKFFF